jgi:hypothetical protein
MGCDEFYPHLYTATDPTNGKKITISFVGIPYTSPVALLIGAYSLNPPLKSQWGPWYLGFPYLAVGPLAGIPAPGGILSLTADLSGVVPGPLSLPVQAIIGDELTGLSWLKIE